MYERDQNGNIVRRTPVRFLRVAVGRTVLNSKQGQIRQVRRVAIHPRYDDRTRANDVAVLKLRRPYQRAVPIALAAPRMNGPERPGRSATVAG